MFILSFSNVPYFVFTVHLVFFVCIHSVASINTIHRVASSFSEKIREKNLVRFVFYAKRYGNDHVRPKIHENLKRRTRISDLLERWEAGW